MINVNKKNVQHKSLPTKENETYICFLGTQLSSS